MADKPLVAVLAAGLGTRFGGGKLDADCAGKPLGQWVLDAVNEAGLAPGVIVVGPQPPGFATASGWEILTNPLPIIGLGSSVAIAAKHALARSSALLLLLADMPLIASDFLERLGRSQGPMATCYPDGRAGVPALLPLVCLPQVAALKGERGAGPLLTALAGLTLIEPDHAILLDVDTADDLAEVAVRLGKGRS